MRTKFTLETINNLKNNRMKTGIAASAIISEHTVRMKKILGSLNTRNVKASEPLRIELKDIRESDKRGKWWLVGASYKDAAQKNPGPLETNLELLLNGNKFQVAAAQSVTSDLAQVAREHGMNTDIRRSIFVAIMSATDYHDAYLRLMKLRLRKSQELEIPRVLIHCAGAEKSYNPYYTLLSRRVCSDRKLKIAFQFSLWDMFKLMSGDREDDEDQDESDNFGVKMGLRSIVNLSKMFGSLITDGGLSLSVLKVSWARTHHSLLVADSEQNLNLLYLEPKTSTFVELLLITVILQSQKGCHGSRDEKKLLDLFLQSKDMPGMARGLRYFLRKVVGKTDVGGSAADKETIKWGCRLARDALQALDSSNEMV